MTGGWGEKVHGPTERPGTSPCYGKASVVPLDAAMTVQVMKLRGTRQRQL